MGLKAQRGLRPDLRALGLGPGPYLVLPFLELEHGARRRRHRLDWFRAAGEECGRSSCATRCTAAPRQRADLLEASRILEEAALDKYVFQRDAYLQRRRSLVHDGNPPREKLE